MWTCPNCSEEIEDEFDVCWNCQTERGGAPKAEAGASTPADATRPSPAVHRAGRALVEQLEKRYRDAYRVGRATIFFAGVSKLLGFAFAGLSIVFAATGYEQSGALAVAGGGFGVFTGVLLYVGGVLMAAQGQLLLTSVDGVINTSPFLSNTERAEIMRVSLDEVGDPEDREPTAAVQ
jgi:hypothetical protein